MIREHSMDAISEDPPSQNPECGHDVARLEAEVNRVQDLYVRTLADLDNFRKKVQQEQARTTRAGKRQILLRICDVIDSFERALGQTSGLPESLLEGFYLIHRQLLHILKREGVTPMETLGKTFDPSLHEAVTTVADERPSGTIVGELFRGYRWQDELLRPAKVSVAC
jgi:molecular chaperone GrpE